MLHKIKKQPKKRNTIMMIFLWEVGLVNLYPGVGKRINGLAGSKSAIAVSREEGFKSWQHGFHSDLLGLKLDRCLFAFTSPSVLIDLHILC